MTEHKSFFGTWLYAYGSPPKCVKVINFHRVVTTTARVEGNKLIKEQVAAAGSGYHTTTEVNIFSFLKYNYKTLWWIYSFAILIWKTSNQKLGYTMNVQEILYFLVSILWWLDKTYWTHSTSITLEKFDDCATYQYLDKNHILTFKALHNMYSYMGYSTLKKNQIWNSSTFFW